MEVLGRNSVGYDGKVWAFVSNKKAGFELQFKTRQYHLVIKQCIIPFRFLESYKHFARGNNHWPFYQHSV